MNRNATLAAVAVVVLLSASACSGGTTAKAPLPTSASATDVAGSASLSPPTSEAPSPRTVPVEMVDIAFRPARLQVVQGETITFAFHNSGMVPHDAIVGDKAAQAKHESEMLAATEGHGHGHSDGQAVVVAAGGSGSLSHTFDTAGTFEVGCHQPGHYAAGMVITVTVGAAT